SRPGWPRKQSRVCSIRVRPSRGRYCLGRSARMRAPTPAAGITTQKDGLVSVLATQLEQGLAFLDHAQLMPGTLLDGLQTLLQLDDLCGEYAVALQQFFVLALLTGDFLLELGDMRQTALAHPQTVLQCGEQSQRYYPEPFQADNLHKGAVNRTLLRLSATELGAAFVGRLACQLLFNAQQLVVLGYPVGTAQRAGLDLTCGSPHRQIGNGVVFGFTAAVRDHRGVAGSLGHL